jgi:Coenzyme PQQ synthesis protein D (PqqD)
MRGSSRHEIDEEHQVPTDNGLQSTDTLPAIAGATVISRSPSVLTAEVDGEIVMMSIEQGRYFGLDDIGSDIWKRLEQPCSFAALIDRLVADYDADPTTIAADVEALLARMVAHDVVRLA